MTTVTVPSTRPNSGTISKVWRAHVRRKGQSDKIASDQLRLLTRLASHARKHPFDVTQKDIEVWFDDINVSPSTALTYVSQLASLYTYLADRFEFGDPTTGIERPKRPKRLPRPIPQEVLSEKYKLYAASVDPGDRRMRAILALDCLGGLRCSDIANLQGEGVDVASRQLRVIGKGNKERAIPLHAEVLRAVFAWRAPKPGRPVISWLNDPERPLKARVVSTLVSDALGGDWVAHQGRHSFATSFYQDSHDLRLLQAILGHESLATTALYAATDTTQAQEVVDRLTL